ncbi:hypothetical protein [Bifidobacterium sp. SO1]|uniref:hypothetical protein n=1 Tax=Bifidobacterium sp. SO1 TaxID=2809029 RepID=UPI001BDC69D8|nr:hypothetical protein [Bifidobacterium sp. SO1]MBT1161751.1 hypothetical protein [Bifidobacterium sp. SO1]
MLNVEWDGLTVTAGESKWLHVASMALRIHEASAREYARANELSWLAWRPPCSFLPDAIDHVTPSGDDWRWLHDGGYRLLNMSGMPYGSGVMYARSLTGRLDEKHAGAAAMILASAAHVARLDARAWSLALLQSFPKDWRHDVQWLPSADPLLGWSGLWATPDLIDGVTGPGIGLALADCARACMWRRDSVVGADGRVVVIPDVVWDHVERLGWVHSFTDDGPEF